MEDNNKSNDNGLISEGRKSGSYFYTQGTPTNKPNQSNSGLISEGRKPNGYNINRNSYNYINNNSSNNNIRRNNIPLTSQNKVGRPTYSNDEQENEEYYEQPTSRKAASDVALKVKKAKDTISFFQKYKIVIIGCIIAFAIVILFMFLMMSIELDGDNKDDNTSSTSYDEITMNTNGSGNEELWWPIGSSEVTTSIDIDGNNVEFRSGTPVLTRISSGYKTPDRPEHAALDITAGGDIYLIAMADGVVKEIKCGTDAKPCTRDTGYNTYGGNSNACTSEGEVSIAIKYNNGYESKYLHLENSSIPEFLKDGSKVYQGQVVGKMGNTGCSDGQHLHLALSVNNEAVNPQNFVSSDNPRPLSEDTQKKSEEILKDNNDRDKAQKESLSEENIVGNDNKQKVCFALKNYYSDNAVAGIMVNVEKESSFDPTNSYMEADGYPSAGLFQWHKGRLNLLKSMYGNEWTLISNQIEYFRYELSTTEKKTALILNNTSLSVSEVAYQFCKTFERAKDCSPRKNQTIANKYETYVKNDCK